MPPTVDSCPYSVVQSPKSHPNIGLLFRFLIFSILKWTGEVLAAAPDPPGAVDRSVKWGEAVILSIGPFGRLVPFAPSLFSNSARVSVLGADDTVKESLKSIAGAFASGVSGRTYGTSGCLEYGNTGNTVITPVAHINLPGVLRRERVCTPCTSYFTGTEHDEEFHEDFVDFSTSSGDDEDIFPADAFLDLD